MRGKNTSWLWFNFKNLIKKVIPLCKQNEDFRYTSKNTECIIKRNDLPPKKIDKGV